VAYDLALIDGVVYACGSYSNGYDRIACFWVGSTKYNLQGSNYNSYAYSMFYDGSEFYIAGSHTDGKPCYFSAELNGDHSLGSFKTTWTGATADARDICIVGNTLYAVGHLYSSGGYYAYFWENNTVKQIWGVGTAQGTRANAICASKDVLYIAGENYDGAACFWTRDIDGGTLFWETVLYENGGATAVFVK
jgi:uncharacterized membrane protein